MAAMATSKLMDTIENIKMSTEYEGIPTKSFSPLE